MKKILKKSTSLLLIVAMILVSLPFGNITFATVADPEYVTFKNSQRTASVTYNYDGINSTVVTSSSGVTVQIPLDTVVTVTVQSKGNTPFPGKVKYETGGNGGLTIDDAPFIFTVGDTDDYGDFVSLVTSWKDDASFFVYFDSDGGTEVPTQLVDKHDSAIEPTDPTKDHYTFAGWYEDTDLYDFSSKVTGDVELLAHWTPNEYVATFHPENGDDNFTDEVTYPGTLEAPSVPEKTGYDFTGWFEDESETAFVFGNTLEGPIDLYAGWEAQEHTAYYFMTTESGTHFDSDTIVYDNTLSEPTDPTRTGYTFVDWFELESETAFVFGNVLLADVNLYADWTALSFKAYFYMEVEDTVAYLDKEVEYPNPLLAPTQPTKTGYDFTGWFENEAVVAYDFGVAILTDVHLYAHWTPQSYTASYYMDPIADNPFSTDTLVYDAPLVKPEDPEQTGYTFDGWFEEDSEVIFDEFDEPLLEDTDLYAHWTAKEFTATFHPDNGTGAFDVDVIYPNTLGLPEEPEKQGHTFVNWFEDESENPYVFGNVLLEDIDLYAEWSINTYTVAFVVGEGEPVPTTQIVVYNQYASEPDDPEWDANTFEGWFLGQATEEFDFENTQITGNITLVAKWEGIPLYTVTFYDGAYEYHSDTVYSGEAVYAPVDPIKEGYTFEGWHGLYVFGEALDDDYSMYAQWQMIHTVIITENPEVEVESDGIVLRIGYNRTPEEAFEQLYYALVPSLEQSYLAEWTIVSGATLITLDEFGLVTGINPGNAVVRVTVSYDDYYEYTSEDVSEYQNMIYDDISVQVIKYYPPTPPTPRPRPTATPNITLDRHEVELEVGTDALEEFLAYDFTETITNSSDKRVSWSIGDEEIATVDENGVVTAVSQGETTVTVRHTASGDTDTATIIVFLVGDEPNALGEVTFNEPYVFGYPDVTFRPRNSVTRAEVATMFAKILNLQVVRPGGQIFDDVKPDTWYYNYVQAIRKTDIFVGDASGNFRPDEPMTRAEIATVFAKYWEYLEIPVNRNIVDITDVDGTHWASAYIYMMYNSGIVVGFADGSYKPNEPTLREQVVVMINTLIARPSYEAEASKFIDIDKTHWAYGNIEAASQIFLGTNSIFSE